MKTLYESILDNDFEVDDKSAAALAIQEILTKPHNHTATVKFVEDKFVVDFKNPFCICEDTEELLTVMETSGVKKIVFNGYVNLTFNRNATFKGYDISAEWAGLIFLNNCKITFENCTLRFAEDLRCGAPKTNSNGKLVLGKGTTVYALSLELNALNCEMDRTAQLNLNYEICINNPTNAQRRWMKKSGIPMSYNDIQNQMSPDMWTEPLSGLLKTEKLITDHVVIRGDNLDFIYKFYSISPDHMNEEIISFDLASGWTLNIDDQK